MRLWRICRQPHVGTALQGIGGLHAGGRWHRKGHLIVYTASSAALAALEVLVHVDPLTAPTDLRLLAIDAPDDLSLETLDRATLPRDWAAVPAPPRLQLAGTSWLTAGRTAALVVPSAIIPAESNVLLNPGHPDSLRARIVDDEPFSFDPRLLRSP